VKIAKFEHGDAVRWGTITDGGAVDLTPLLGSSPDDLLHEQGDSADEEEQLETLSRSASAMPQGPAPAQILHVAKGLLDARP